MLEQFGLSLRHSFHSTTVHAQGIPIAIARAIAYASSGCDQLIAGFYFIVAGQKSGQAMA